MQNINEFPLVFLRHLEYFSGIVFLTSNRVAAFDHAMKSRIHLALQYSPPEIQMRRLIWMQYLKAIPSSEVSMNLATVIDILIREKLNGREISNTINTAQTISRFEKRKLELRDIETVLQTRREFDASITKLKTLQAAELREGSLLPVRRQNSLIACSDEPSAWLP
jgi:AAA+ superfamily predicted ATPase